MNIPYRPLALGLVALAFSAIVLEPRPGRRQPLLPPGRRPGGQGGVRQLPPCLRPVDAAGQFVATHDGQPEETTSATTPASMRTPPPELPSYLVANAADTGGQRYSGKLLRGVAPNSAPLRITELPKWVSEHRKVPAWEWKHKDVRTKANCVACHADAERGYYDD